MKKVYKFEPSLILLFFRLLISAGILTFLLFLIYLFFIFFKKGQILVMKDIPDSIFTTVTFSIFVLFLSVYYFHDKRLYSKRRIELTESELRVIGYPRFSDRLIVPLSSIYKVATSVRQVHPIEKGFTLEIAFPVPLLLPMGWMRSMRFVHIFYRQNNEKKCLAFVPDNWKNFRDLLQELHVRTQAEFSLGTRWIKG